MPYTSNPKLPRLRMRAVLMVRRGASTHEVAKYFGYNQSTIARWVQRANKDLLLGSENLPTRSSRPRAHPKALASEIVAAIVQERLARGRCAEVIHATLAKRGVSVSLSSVKRTLRREELIAPRSKWKRYRPPVARPLADAPGSLVQTDTIHFVDWYTKDRFYIYTVIDLHTRMAHTAVHDRLSQRWSYQTLLEAQTLFGFAFAMVQADNGPEFSRWLNDMLVAKGIALRHSRVRRSNDNAHIERFNRTIQQECLGPRPQRGQVTQAKLDTYIRYYNHDRLHLEIELQTPSEKYQKAGLTAGSVMRRY